MLFSLVAGAGITGVLVWFGLARVAKSKTERESRRRADLIRQRLAEQQPRVTHHEVEIRLGRSAGR